MWQIFLLSIVTNSFQILDKHLSYYLPVDRPCFTWLWYASNYAPSPDSGVKILGSWHLSFVKTVLDWSLVIRHSLPLIHHKINFSLNLVGGMMLVNWVYLNILLQYSRTCVESDEWCSLCKVGDRNHQMLARSSSKRCSIVGIFTQTGLTHHHHWALSIIRYKTPSLREIVFNTW